MSQIDKTTFNALYNNSTGGVFPNNSTQEISAADVRQSMGDIKDSFLNKTDESFNGIKGLNPGVSTTTDLKALITATSKMPVGVLTAFIDATASNALRVYVLTAGTTAESLPDVVRPNDYAASTNEKIWILGVVGSGGGGVTSVNGDSGPTVVLDAADIGSTPAGGLSSTDVQGALNELDTEKVSVSGSQLHATASGTDTYTASLTPTPAYAAGLTIRIKFTNGNTGASTINLNSLGAKSIKKNVSSDLASGDIPSGAIVEMVYDGTNFQAIGIFTAVGATWGSITGTLSTQSDLNTALNAKVDETDWVTLTDGATTTWDTTNLQNPIAKWTMGATSRTLAMTNVKSGASGLLVVKTGVSGAITLTFPAGSVTDAGSLTTYIFPAGINVFYDLSWWYDSATTTTKWIIGVSNIDTDSTMAADSDTLVASQKATKTALALKENTANKAVDFSTLNNVKFPTTQAVNDLINITVSGLNPKLDVRAATTGNITLSGAQTIDGVSIVAGERVLVKNQTTGSQNGIYVAASGAWSRSSDAAIASQLLGALVLVSEGTLNTNTIWRQTVTGTITVGTTALVWSQPYRAQPLASTGTAVAFDVDRHYGFSSAETGNITLNSTGLRSGITQFMKHNSGSTPSFGSEFEVISGAYSVSVNNLLTFYSLSASKIFVTITQIA